MKGKIGLVVGLGAGYVMGTRAGRERYEQIKKQWLKLWHLDPVQKQVTKAKAFAAEKTAAIPSAVWSGVVKAAKATGKAADQAADVVEDAADEVAEIAAEAAKKK